MLTPMNGQIRFPIVQRHYLLSKTSMELMFVFLECMYRNMVRKVALQIQGNQLHSICYLYQKTNQFNISDVYI